MSSAKWNFQNKKAGKRSLGNHCFGKKSAVCYRIKPQFFSKNKKRGARCDSIMGQNEKIVPIIMKRM